jgi:outer membrane protein assembly factor BamA
LEAVKIEGTQLTSAVVLDMSGLRVGSPVNEAAMQEGCRKLQASGLFQTVGFRYAPGPKQGYVLTLTLLDQTVLLDASIDVPGLDETETWQWLTSRYPRFQHKVPGDETGQLFLARQIEQHLGVRLDGQHLVARLESDLTHGKTIVSFQPETLPAIGAMSFTGQQEFNEADLRHIMEKVVANEGYLDRHYRAYVELNLRRAYEEHGMYRVQFPTIAARKDGIAIAVTTAIEEGPKYSLGTVELTGEALPTKAMLEAAKFKTGSLANWTEIQLDIWESEKPVKRLGYTDAAAISERVFRDDQRLLDLKIDYRKGPLYHFGELRIAGLSPEMESQARKMWQLHAGDPYDYAYPYEFLREFAKSLRQPMFKRFDVATAKGTGDHVTDVSLSFIPK